jgi:hypothetical protein
VAALGMGLLALSRDEILVWNQCVIGDRTFGTFGMGDPRTPYMNELLTTIFPYRGRLPKVQNPRFRIQPIDKYGLLLSDLLAFWHEREQWRHIPTGGLEDG